MTKKEEVLMPPLLEGLIKDTLNNKVDVWKRQPYRTRLAEYRNILDTAIRKYDDEYTKASNSKGKKKAS